MRKIIGKIYRFKSILLAALALSAPAFATTNNLTEASNNFTTPENNTFFAAYYPSWHEPYYSVFCSSYGQYKDPDTGIWAECTPNSLLSDTYISANALLAGGIPDYVTHVILSFAQFNSMRNYTGLSDNPHDLLAIGLQSNSSLKSLKEAIRVLKENNPDTKIILALGGSSYTDSWNSIIDADIDGLNQLMSDLDLDGLNINYSIFSSDNLDPNKYHQAIKDTYNAIVKFNETYNRNTTLSLTGYSLGADCTNETQGSAYPDCEGRNSLWHEESNPGRERKVLQGMGANEMIDLVLINSFDAGFEAFDPIVAYNQYKAIVKPGTPLAIGVQPGPDEGGIPVQSSIYQAKTLVNDLGIHNDCEENVIQADQYGNPTPGTFSIERFANAVKQNPGDGMMMWSLFASRPAEQCGSVTLNTVTEIGQAISEQLGIGSDRTTQLDWETATSYGR